jgi:ribosome maturation factor RimP
MIDLIAALRPVVDSADLELVDVEFRSGVLLVTVDRPGGVDLQALTDANRVVSKVLDELDPFPGTYSLEVSSPGVERPLRTQEHFAKAVGEMVSIKVRPQVEGERRLRARLLAADDEGIELQIEGTAGTAEDGVAGVAGRRLSYSDIDRARTVFVWGPAEHDNRSRKGSASDRGSKTQTRQVKEKRKQVVTP